MITFALLQKLFKLFKTGSIHVENRKKKRLWGKKPIGDVIHIVMTAPPVPSGARKLELNWKCLGKQLTIQKLFVQNKKRHVSKMSAGEFGSVKTRISDKRRVRWHRRGVKSWSRYTPELMLSRLATLSMPAWWFSVEWSNGARSKQWMKQWSLSVEIMHHWFGR